MKTYKYILPQDNHLPEDNRLLPLLGFLFAIGALAASFFQGYGILLAFPGLVFSLLALAESRGRVLSIIALCLSFLALIISLVVILLIYHTPTQATQLEKTYYVETTLEASTLASAIDAYLIKTDEKNLEELLHNITSIKTLSAPKDHEQKRNAMEIYLDDIKGAANAIKKNKNSIYQNSRTMYASQELIQQLLEDGMLDSDLKKEAITLFSDTDSINQERLQTYIKQALSIHNSDEKDKLAKLETLDYLLDTSTLYTYFPTDSWGNTDFPLKNLIRGYKEMELALKLKDNSLEKEASKKIYEAEQSLKELQK